MPDPPQNPAGEFVPPDKTDADSRSRIVSAIAELPERLRSLVRDLNDEQLQSRYRNWSIRQIVHHLADSHMHAYIRCKWALTEDCPRIKAYDETRWSELEDARHADVQPSLTLLQGLHARWVDALTRMNSRDYERTFEHPETGAVEPLWRVLPYYAWHGRHHTAQIEWIRRHHG